MAPPPSLQGLIDLVEREAPTTTPLDRLGTAAATVAQLEDVGDAVLSHFVDQARRSGHSWSEISSAMGVTKQAAHKRFSDASPTMGRFTPRARTVMEHAPSIARALGHNSVGTEHILLALYEEPEGIAAKVLVELGAPRDEVAREVLARVARSNASVSGAVPLTPKAVDTVTRTLKVALSLGHNYVGTEHILLALLADSDALATQVLGALGLDHDRVRARIVEILSGYTKS
jgi:Clp amino terminal domain, pathogenicity island component